MLTHLCFRFRGRTYTLCPVLLGQTLESKLGDALLGEPELPITFEQST